MRQIALKRKPFFYDAQLARMLVQLLACFSGYQVMSGNQRDGKLRFTDVPTILGDASYVVQYMQTGGTENIIPGLPVISLYMTGLRQKAEWRLNPDHYEYLNIIERKRDANGDFIVNEPGRRRTIERVNPIPYDMDFSVAIWASNNFQGYQLVEQICSVFGPTMDVALSNSPADWAWLSTIIFQGDVKLEKAIPNLGGQADVDPLYTFVMDFKVQVYMSLPVKIYTSKPIYSVHVPFEELEREQDGSVDFDSLDQIDGLVIKANPVAVAQSEAEQTG